MEREREAPRPRCLETQKMPGYRYWEEGVGRDTGGREKTESVAREREAEIRRVYLGHTAAQKGHIHQSQAPPTRGRANPAATIGETSEGWCRILLLLS